MRFLQAAQADDGSFSKQYGPGVTALVATALLENGVPADRPIVAKSLSYVLSFQREDGGIYAPGSTYRNYETCLAIMCLAAAKNDAQYGEIITKADGFVRGLQWDDSEGRDESDFAWGGAGYGRHKRPDLSNTGFLVEALKASGAGKDDPALQKALAFVSRCQNLETEANTTPFATKNPDGGFYYTPAAGGSSQAGETPTGGLRSYGSMTYVGLKSMIFAGVERDDPRVQAAVTWARQHYTLEENPGMGPAGYFYYLHTFSKALSTFGEREFKDASGQVHNWQGELIQKLAELQKPDGSWVNANDRWLEGNPDLVTAYALLALAYCQ